MKHHMSDGLSEILEQYILYAKVCHIPEEWKDKKVEYISNFVHDAMRRKKDYENNNRRNKL